MDDSISRQAVLDWITASINQYGGRYTYDQLNMWGLFSQMVTEFPSAQKVGKWIEDRSLGILHHRCSKCDNLAWKTSAYCPFCGAKMEDEQDGDDE